MLWIYWPGRLNLFHRKQPNILLQDLSLLLLLLLSPVTTPPQQLGLELLPHLALPNLFYLSLEVGREKVNMSVGFSNETKHFLVFIIRKAQSHTLTSMMGTTSALRRSNEQQFSALLYYIFIIE